MESKQVVLLGPPGVGVESQAIALAERWHVPFVSADELFGAAVENEPLLDDARLKLIRRRFEQPDVMLKGWILSGFPRSLAQAEAFDQLLSGFGLEAANAVFLKARTGLLISRLAADAGESATVLRGRVAAYEGAIGPVIEYYEQRDRLVTVNANLSEAEVANALAQIGEEETGAARFVRDEAELDLLIKQETLLVVDCVASWCGPCKLVSPLIDRLAEEMGDRASVVKLDFDNNRQVSKRFGLTGMPSVMLFKQGELMTTLTGVKSYELYSAMVKSLLP